MILLLPPTIEHRNIGMPVIIIMYVAYSPKIFNWEKITNFSVKTKSEAKFELEIKCENYLLLCNCRILMIIHSFQNMKPVDFPPLDIVPAPQRFPLILYLEVL